MPKDTFQPSRLPKITYCPPAIAGGYPTFTTPMLKKFPRPIMDKASYTPNSSYIDPAFDADQPHLS